MAIRKATLELLSAIRRTGSFSALRELPEDFFISDEERQAIQWLRNYVTEHRQFPKRSTFARGIGEQAARTVEPVSYYYDQVRKRALYYHIASVAGDLQDALLDKDPDASVEAAKRIIAANSRLSVRSTGISSLADSLDDVLDDIENLRWNPDMMGILSGWPYVDQKTGGWQNGDLITVVGRPGMGKTWLCLRCAHEAWRSGRSVLFVSMEMTQKQLARRFLALETHYNPDRLRRGQISSDIFNAMRDTARFVRGGVPITLIAGNFKKSVDSVRATIEDMQPDLIVVDASYLLTPEKKRQGSGGRREVVSDVIEELGSMAKTYDRPVINSVQFNRQAVRPHSLRRTEENASPNPMLHLGLEKIGETDVVGQVSSIVIGMTTPPDGGNNSRYIGFLKGREGEQGYCKINWNFDRVDLSEIPGENEEAIRERMRERNGDSQTTATAENPINQEALNNFRG